MTTTLCRRLCYESQQSLCGATSIALSVTQNVKLAFGKTEGRLMEQTSLDAGRGHRGRDGGRSKTRFDGSAYGFVGR